METDSFYRMGSTHSVCQDYAASGVSPFGDVRAAVSDGCSTALDSDWGARFLARAAMTEKEIGTFSVLDAAKDMIAASRLPRQALRATLLIAYVLSNGEVRAYRSGDGVIVTRARSGFVAYERVEFEGNMPPYLSYIGVHSDVDEYYQLCRTQTITLGARDLGGKWTRKESQDFPSVIGHSSLLGSPRELDLVLLFSDGVESFQDRDGNVVPLETILDELLAIRNFKGQFLGRRCGAFLQRTCAERGWKHSDDFSVAGIYFGDTQ